VPSSSPTLRYSSHPHHALGTTYSAYSKLDLGKSWGDSKRDLDKYLRLRREREYGNRSSVGTWKRAQYVDTVGFWRAAIFYVGASRGVNWLIRARCSGIWTVKRAIKFGLIEADTVRGKCAACMEDLGETPEFQHIMLDCTKFEDPRRNLREVLGVMPETLPPDDRIRILLGGSSVVRAEDGSRFSLGHRWSGEGSEGFGEPKLPGFVPVAKFLGLALPVYMVELWRWRKEAAEGPVRRAAEAD
jgi:hypothetical protein